MPTDSESNSIINRIMKAGNDAIEKNRQVKEFKKRTGMGSTEIKKAMRGGQKARSAQIKSAAKLVLKESGKLDDSFVPKFTQPGKETRGVKFPKEHFGKIITGKSIKRFAKFIAGIARGLPSIGVQAPKVDPVGLRGRTKAEKSKL